VGLSINDRLKEALLPSWLYYRQKIAKEARKMEPELRILRDLVPAGRTAIDVGANRGYYSYALSKLARRVEAFEPHPELARFARTKLGRKAHVHEVALSNRAGTATLYIPQLRHGIDVHYGSSLKRVYHDLAPVFVEITVRMATLDEFAFDDVGFIKIDVEGSDMDVIEGGRKTIARDRPTMIVELVAITHADPLACVEHIKEAFRYDARIMVDGRLVDAQAALQKPPQAWGTFNVVFTPK
jgi:FkbM family methyltransferase